MLPSDIVIMLKGLLTVDRLFDIILNESVQTCSTHMRIGRFSCSLWEFGITIFPLEGLL